MGANYYCGSFPKEMKCDICGELTQTEYMDRDRVHKNLSNAYPKWVCNGCEIKALVIDEWIDKLREIERNRRSPIRDENLRQRLEIAAEKMNQIKEIIHSGEVEQIYESS